MLERIKQWFRLGLHRWSHRHDRTDPDISMDSECFWYRTSEGVLRRFYWSEILEIRAFKRDLFTVDQVRFTFLMNGQWADVWEEQPGFTELVTQLETRFPSVVGWESKIMHPAFARNETVLYKRFPDPLGQAGSTAEKPDYG